MVASSRIKIQHKEPMKGSAFLCNTHSSCGSFYLSVIKGQDFVRFGTVRHTDNIIYS